MNSTVKTSGRFLKSRGLGQAFPPFPSPTSLLPLFCSCLIFRAVRMWKNSFARNSFVFSLCVSSVLRSIKMNISDMQCRQPLVWSVYLNFSTLSCQNYFFQRVLGVYVKLVEIQEGWEVIFAFKTWKFRGGDGTCVKFPPWQWGMDIFWNYTFTPISNTPFSKCTFMALLHLVLQIIKSKNKNFTMDFWST